MELYIECTNAGSNLAIGRMGMHYLEGEGLEKDVGKGLEMLERAGRKGDGGALYYLGCSYRDGNGVEQDFKKAVAYLKRSAGRKEPSACEALGDIYSTDEYGLHSARKAAKWYLKGARMGGQGCMAKTSRMYSEGILTRKDEAKARMWNERFLDMDSKIYGYER